MYTPIHFEENREEILCDFISSHPLAAIVWRSPDGMVADHIPLFFKQTDEDQGFLIGHVAKNNPIWRHASAQNVLVIFQGPNAYISPNWYSTKQDGGKVVPTWNYAAVHVNGTLRTIDDPQWVLQQLETLTLIHERSQLNPWHISDAPLEYINRMVDAVVGIEIAITKLSGKWKVSQNQPAQNRCSVAEGLKASGSEAANAIAKLVLNAKE